MLFFVGFSNFSGFLAVGTVFAYQFSDGGNMQKVNINDLPNLFRENKITKQEIINILWAEIYTKPNFYGLQDFDEDEKSDFLIDFREKIILILKNYDEKQGCLQSFLRGCIKFRKISWEKKRRQEEISSQTAGIFLAGKSKDEYSSKFEDNLSESEKGNHKILKNGSKCKMKIKALTMLILTLKACREIDDNLISKISDFTGLTEDVLQKLVQEMKNVAFKKEEKREKLIAKRNNAFYFRRKYGLEMQNLGNDALSYSNLKERYENQSKNWIKNNALLTRSSVTSPSNNEIAKKLGLKPRTVGFYLFCARKTFGNLENSEYKGDEETETE